MLADDFDAPAPRFLVEPPDRSPSPEQPRQTAFLRDMRLLAPEVLVYANANAGKRAIHTARREGIRAGVFDLCAVWNRGIAWLEFKGREAPAKGSRPGTLGRPGTLSAAQIEFGNRLVEMGFPCGCFFDPVNAMRWLAELGAQVRM